MSRILIAMLMAAFAPFALAQAGDSAQPRAQPPIDGPRIQLDNSGFVKEAAAAGQTEVALSQVALKKSKNPAVRTFALRMVADHGAAGEQLRRIATGKNIAVPAQLDAAQQAEIDQMEKLDGVAFDQAYVQVMAKDHDQAVALFTAAANDAALDPQLKQFAAKTLPVLREHQLHAHQLDSASTTGSR